MDLIGIPDLENTQLGVFAWPKVPDTEAPSAPKNCKKRKDVFLEKPIVCDQCDQCDYCCTQSSTLKYRIKIRNLVENYLSYFCRSPQTKCVESGKTCLNSQP